MLESPFRGEFEAEYGSLMFLNTEIALKTFSAVRPLQPGGEIRQPRLYRL